MKINVHIFLDCLFEKNKGTINYCDGYINENYGKQIFKLINLINLINLSQINIGN